MKNILQNGKGNIILIVLVIAAIGGLVFFMPQLSKNFSGVTPQPQSEAPAQNAPKGNVALMLDPVTVSAAANKTFTIDVKVDTKDDSVSAAELYVTYDPEYLEAKSIVPGAPLPVELQKGKVESGMASIVIGSQPTSPYKGSSSIAKVTFMAKKAGMTEIKLDSKTAAVAVGKTGNVVSSTAGTSVDIK